MSDHNKSGFTLIEIIVVITILGILAAILIPAVSGYIRQARLAADQATLRTLNTVTHLFRTAPLPEDPFLDESKSNEELLEILVDSKLIAANPEPQNKDAAFIWNRQHEQWLYNFYTLAEPLRYRYLFANMVKDDFIYNTWGGGGGATWSIDQNGLTVTGAGNQDLLFIGNDKREYTLTTRFSLNENPGENGGLGIFFETVLNAQDSNRDTGYILQFDRGFSEIVLRKRIDGSESNSADMLLARIGNRSTSTIKNASIPYKTDSSWWESDKEVSLSVRESKNPGEKLVTVVLDGQIILQDFAIESSIQAPNNHTGFRAWNNQPATIYDLIVE